MIFGNRIRELRENKNLVLRKLAAKLDIDTATMSKIERGDRCAKKEHLPILAEILEVDVEKLKTLWLAEKVYTLVSQEPEGLKALKVAESQMEYSSVKTLNK